MHRPFRGHPGRWGSSPHAGWVPGPGRRRTVELIPDLVWYDLDGAPLAVVDAKYKAEKYDGFPNPDIYQTLAYCTAFGLPSGHLVYARGNEVPRAHRISKADIYVVAHCLDLRTFRPNCLARSSACQRDSERPSSAIGA